MSVKTVEIDKFTWDSHIRTSKNIFISHLLPVFKNIEKDHVTYFHPIQNEDVMNIFLYFLYFCEYEISSLQDISNLAIEPSTFKTPAYHFQKPLLKIPTFCVTQNTSCTFVR